jgi:hypothetical protein
MSGCNEYESAYTLAFQGFYNEGLIIKEIALVHVNSGNVVQHLLFKTTPGLFNSLSEKFKRTNRWLTNSFHGISWCSGFAELKDLNLPSGTIFVKGKEIKKLMENMNSDANIINLEDCGCNERLEDLSLTCRSCNYHKFETLKCAVNGAKALAQWLRNNTH